MTATGIAYIKTFRTGATQLNTLAYAGQWMRMGTPVDEAIAYANNGYTPAEVKALIARCADTITTIAHMIDAIVNGTTRLRRYMGADRLYAHHADGTNYTIEIAGRTATLLDIDCTYTLGGDIPLHGVPCLIARDAHRTLSAARH